MNENNISRRSFSKTLIGTALSVTFLETLFTGCSRENKLEIVKSNNIIDPKPVELLNHWAIELNEICQDLKKNNLSQLQWQNQIDKLYSRIELSDLLKFINFEKLIENFEYPDLGVATKQVKFPRLDGLVADTVFTKKIFGMKKGRAIIPHGHSNMASAHLILNGNLSLRHYEKIKDEKNHLIIKPTIEKTVQVGDYSSISDEKDNVHWFIAESDAAFTFDVIMTDLKNQKYEIHNLDITESSKLENGLLKTPKIDVNTALKKYGKTHH
jgi:hypothetical protein